MRWTERQKRLLGELGVRLVEPVAAVDPAGATPPAVAVPEGRVPRAGRAAPQAPEPPRGPASAHEAFAPEAVPPAAGPAGGVDAMDWPALRAAVEACTACGLCRSRRQPVFGIGHPQARWMVVGEAPGEQEDQRGEPFVGKSGQLLDNMLRAIGLGRDEGPRETQVYIANTLKCRPPGNRNPEPAELAQCEPFLVRQVALVQPAIILAMGRFAVQSLLRSDEPIGRLRGRVHRYRGVPLIVTYHPAYLLRNPDDKAKAWDDLCLAVQTLAASAPA